MIKSCALNNQDKAARAERRANDICPYEIIPSALVATNIGDVKEDKPRLPGYLGTYGVDCKEVNTLLFYLTLHLVCSSVGS